MQALQSFLAICFCLSQVSAATTKCDDNIINKIKEHWKRCGEPGVVLQDKGQVFTIYQTTPSAQYDGIECMSFTANGDGNITVKLNENEYIIPGDETTKPGYVGFGYEEMSIKIKACLDDGIYIGYQCSLNGTVATAEDPIDLGIMITGNASDVSKKEAEALLFELFGVKNLKSYPNCAPRSV